ncbi:uncharacterized protein LOC113226605 [Hyposmocoma kahamanoa]|uniref:uncharacterized protein LOC113226605 n=1 Tax=Hyposmocoma kahamanoa TaxID=1477025 RepID=UPI000E6DA4E7|nr:uncharacterized protein LOC113226605 [Hyposmocoma kahamanoa]
MRMIIPALLILILLEVGSSLADDFIYKFGSHEEDPVIYTTNGKLGLFEYEKEIPIATSIEPSLEVRYVKVLVSSLSPPKVEYDAKYKKITIKYSWAQAPALGGKFRIEVHGSPADTKYNYKYMVAV